MNPISHSSRRFLSVMAGLFLTLCLCLPNNLHAQVPPVPQAYTNAISAINQYQAATTARARKVAQAQAVVAVSAVQPFNDIWVGPQGPGLYDDALNKLIEAVKANLPKKYNQYSVPPDSLGIKTAIQGWLTSMDDEGNVYTVTGGVVYGFRKNGVIETVVPLSTDAITAIDVYDQTMVLGQQDGLGKSYVSVFIRKDKKWLQDTRIDIAALAKASFPGIEVPRLPFYDAIYAVSVTKLTLSDKALMVVIGEKKYFVFNNNYTLRTKSTWPLAITKGFDEGVIVTSIDAADDYIVVGTHHETIQKTGSVTILKSVPVTKTAKGVKLPNAWTWVVDKEFVNQGVLFGGSVAINARGIHPTIAIGSEGLTATATSVILLTTKRNGQWSPFESLSAPTPLATSLFEGIGNGLAMRDNTLVSYYIINENAGSPIGGSTKFVKYGIVVFKHKLSGWTWAYTVLSNSYIFNSVPQPNVFTGNDTVAYYLPQKFTQGGVDLINKINVISPKQPSFKSVGDQIRLLKDILEKLTF